VLGLICCCCSVAVAVGILIWWQSKDDFIAQNEESAYWAY
jgi:hypothetical protein